MPSLCTAISYILIFLVAGAGGVGGEGSNGGGDGSGIGGERSGVGGERSGERSGGRGNHVVVVVLGGGRGLGRLRGRGARPRRIGARENRHDVAVNRRGRGRGPSRDVNRC